MAEEGPVQKFGVHAIGAQVEKEFDGEVYRGTVKAFYKGSDGDVDLYRVVYCDGDEEDLDVEEYNHGYAMYLSTEGYQIEDALSGDSHSEDDAEEKNWKPPKVSSLQYSFIHNSMTIHLTATF